MTAGPSGQARVPPPPRPGDRVRLVSPASPPTEAWVEAQREILAGWGLRVELGRHVFAQQGFLAGSDAARLADLNAAFRDPGVRAVIATRGGKGAYRIADALDFAALRADPKLLVGFSDITVLHLSLWKHCRLLGLHGGLYGGDGGAVAPETLAAMESALTTRAPIRLQADPDEPTARLTRAGGGRDPLRRGGDKVAGRLIGGNLTMIATAAGWALPDLTGAILLVEAMGLERGAIDRPWSMLTKAGYFDGLAGIAFGQFTGIRSSGDWSALDYLGEHLEALGLPVLGGLPLGHGARPRVVPIGGWAEMDTTAGCLTVAWAP